VPGNCAPPPMARVLRRNPRQDKPSKRLANRPTWLNTTKTGRGTGVTGPFRCLFGDPAAGMMPAGLIAGDIFPHR
jgi:hypothetical protein